MPKKMMGMAIAYDFDGTLAPGNMQERSFIPDLKISKREFWNRVKSHAKKHDMDEILSYMYLMRKMADSMDLKITKKAFEEHGRKITDYYRGVLGWFKRINAYAKKKNVKLEHFIISSGLREMIEATTISRHIKHIFASGFMYDQHNVATWPALAVNYTAKVQYLFRINKGINNSYDNSRVNKYTPMNKRLYPFYNMIYIGDGESDIPCMKMMRYQGGYAIAVYKPRKKRARAAAYELIKHERANYAAKADYSPGSQLEKIVRLVIDRVVHASKLLSTEDKEYKEAEYKRRYGR